MLCQSSPKTADSCHPSQGVNRWLPQSQKDSSLGHQSINGARTTHIASKSFLDMVLFCKNLNTSKEILGSGEEMTQQAARGLRSMLTEQRGSLKCFVRGATQPSHNLCFRVELCISGDKAKLLASSCHQGLASVPTVEIGSRSLKNSSYHLCVGSSSVTSIPKVTLGQGWVMVMMVG